VCGTLPDRGYVAVSIELVEIEVVTRKGLWRGWGCRVPEARLVGLAHFDVLAATHRVPSPHRENGPGWSGTRRKGSRAGPHITGPAPRAVRLSLPNTTVSTVPYSEEVEIG
jgi:hypothetical protein